MPQIFSPEADRWPRRLGQGALVAALVAPAMVWTFFSPEHTDVGYQPLQPIPFSHRLHAGELEIDCRYCHASVEVTAAASLPSTTTCMNCHALVGRRSPSLEPLRVSLATGQPVRWIRVHDLPDYAYFDHAAHLAASVDCASCHGDVAAMDRLHQVEPLSMGWCLECHRDPAHRALAPPSECSGCHR